MSVDELQDSTNPTKLGQGHGQLVLSKPVNYEVKEILKGFILLYVVQLI